MWYILGFGLLALTIIIITLLSWRSLKQHQPMIIITSVAFLPFIIGIYGHYNGYTSAIQAIAMADPADKEELLTLSMSYAQIPSIIGGVFSTALIVIGLIGYILNRKARFEKI